MEVSSLRYRVDSRVLARRNIGERINDTVNRLNEIEYKLRSLESAVNNCMDIYCAAEDHVGRQALLLTNSLESFNKTKGKSKAELLWEEATSIMNKEINNESFLSEKDISAINNIDTKKLIESIIDKKMHKNTTGIKSFKNFILSHSIDTNFILSGEKIKFVSYISSKKTKAKVEAIGKIKDVSKELTSGVKSYINNPVKAFNSLNKHVAKPFVINTLGIKKDSITYKTLKYRGIRIEATLVNITNLSKGFVSLAAIASKANNLPNDIFKIEVAEVGKRTGILPKNFANSLENSSLNNIKDVKKFYKKAPSAIVKGTVKDFETTFTPTKEKDFFFNPDATLDEVTEYEMSAINTAAIIVPAGKAATGVKAIDIFSKEDVAAQELIESAAKNGVKTTEAAHKTVFTAEDFNKVEDGLKATKEVEQASKAAKAAEVVPKTAVTTEEGLKLAEKIEQVDKIAVGGEDSAKAAEAVPKTIITTEEGLKSVEEIEQVDKVAVGGEDSAKATEVIPKTAVNTEEGLKTGKEIEQIDKTSYEKSSEIIAKNPLPNIENAKIDPRKLTDYALNLEHPIGGNKAKVFESALGYNKSNASELMNQVYEKLPNSEAVLGKVDQYGQRYTVDMQITGPNANTAIVRTGWILKTGSTTPEMTTIYVK